MQPSLRNQEFVQPPVIEAVDLLNLNTTSSNANIKPSKSSNFDLLSGLDASTDNMGNFQSSTQPSKPQSNIFDPFGMADIQNNLLDDWNNFSSAPKSEPTQQPQKPTDFFADLGNLSGNKGGWNSNISSPNKVPPTTPQNVTPQHKPATPQHQAKSPADYSRSHFEPTADKKGKPDDVFGDLLGQQGYKFSAKKDNFPRTINDMRKEDMATYMDPDKIKIMEWVCKHLFILFSRLKLFKYLFF